MKIGWIGTGVMGNSMAGHLQKAGHELFIYNRTKQKAEGLLGKGAHWCETPDIAAQKAEIVFTIVGYPKDVEEVYLGPKGILSVIGSCRIVVDMSTSRPSLAQRIAAEAEKKGIQSLDAPVSGGDIGARNAALAIMVGGKKEAFEQVMPLFKLMGQNIALMGGPGAGQHTKMSNQILIAGTMIGVCECLLYAVKEGLDQQAVIDIIGKGAAGSWSINNLGPRIVKGDFNPGFFVEHFIKDMEIALAEAASASLSLPGLALVHQLYVALKAQGDGRCGTQALYKVLQRMNGEKA
jgi:3-hydroxyisobutyrate dehydrogenase